MYITFFGVICYPFARYYPIVPNRLYFLLSLPIGVLFLTFIVALFHDLVSLGFKQTNFTPERRDFFKKSLDIGAVSLAIGVNAKAMENAKHIELEKVHVKINDLKKTLFNYSVK